MVLELLHQQLNLLIFFSLATRACQAFGAMEAAAIQPTRAAPTMDASSNRIRRRLGIRSRISHLSLRRLQWPGYSLYEGF